MSEAILLAIPFLGLLYCFLSMAVVGFVDLVSPTALTSVLLMDQSTTALNPLPTADLSTLVHDLVEENTTTSKGRTQGVSSKSKASISPSLITNNSALVPSMIIHDLPSSSSLQPVNKVTTNLMMNENETQGGPKISKIPDSSSPTASISDPFSTSALVTAINEASASALASSKVYEAPTTTNQDLATFMAD